MNLLMRSTNDYGEPLCLSLPNQLESKESPLISSVMWRFVSPKSAGEYRESFAILSDLEDYEGVYTCIMRLKKVSFLFKSLVGMIRIYLSVNCLITLLAVCCASPPALLYKREIKLCVCILERSRVHCSIFRFYILL